MNRPARHCQRFWRLCPPCRWTVRSQERQEGIEGSTRTRERRSQMRSLPQAHRPTASRCSRKMRVTFRWQTCEWKPSVRHLEFGPGVHDTPEEVLEVRHAKGFAPLALSPARKFTGFRRWGGECGLHGTREGIMWTIPRSVFEHLGGRLTGSLVVSFTPNLRPRNHPGPCRNPALERRRCTTAMGSTSP